MSRIKGDRELNGRPFIICLEGGNVETRVEIKIDDNFPNDHV